MPEQLLHSFRAQIAEFAMNDLQRPDGVPVRGREQFLDKGAEREHRREPREACFVPCSYSMVQVDGQGAVTMTSGQAISLNRSGEGLLLLLGLVPSGAQYLEILTMQTFGRRAVSIFEVRWTKRLESSRRAISAWSAAAGCSAHASTSSSEWSSTLQTPVFRTTCSSNAIPL